jgi:hypothetical protein
MDRQHIINEIRRTAKLNGDVALGQKRFENETGISYYDWFGKHWARWGDAIREAGFEPNKLNERFDDLFLVQQLVQLTRRLGRVPVKGDLMLEAQTNPDFPSKNVFARLGSKSQRVTQVLSYCDAYAGFDDVALLWQQTPKSKSPITEVEDSTQQVGFVYMLKTWRTSGVQDRPNEQPFAEGRRAWHPTSGEVRADPLHPD